MLCCCFLASGFTYSWWISNKSRSIPWATGWLWPKSESRARKTLALIWTPWNARWKITRYEIHFVLISMTNFLTLQAFVSSSILSLNLLKIRNLSARNIVWSEGRLAAQGEPFHGYVVYWLTFHLLVLTLLGHTVFPGRPWEAATAGELTDAHGCCSWWEL